MARENEPERKTYSVRLRTDTFDSLKHLAVDEHKPLSRLLEEAAGNLLAKYGKTIPTDDQHDKGGKRGRRDKRRHRGTAK
jgi:hypothetical protein